MASKADLDDVRLRYGEAGRFFYLTFEFENGIEVAWKVVRSDFL
jgi:hypothetical protein